MKTITENLIDELLERGFKEPYMEFQIKRNIKGEIILRFRTFGYVFIREIVLYDDDLEKLFDMIKTKIKPVFENQRLLDKQKNIPSNLSYIEQKLYTDLGEVYLFISIERRIKFLKKDNS